MCSDIYFQPINQWIFTYVICNQSSPQTEVLIAPSTSLVKGRTIRNFMGVGGGGGGLGNFKAVREPGRGWRKNDYQHNLMKPNKFN